MTKSEAMQLAEEIAKLTETAGRTPLFAIKPVLEELAEKQAKFNSAVIALL